MSKRSERNLDMMVRMADDWEEKSNQMVLVAMGLLLWKLEVTSATIRINDIDKFTADYDIVRNYHKGEDDEQCMTVSLVEKEKPSDTEVPAETE